MEVKSSEVDKISEPLLPKLEDENKSKSKSSIAKKKVDCHRYSLAALLATGFLLRAICLNLFGMSLPTFADNLRTTIYNVSPIVMSRGCGYLTGSIFAAILAKYLNLYYIIIGLCFCIATGMICAPTILNIYFLHLSNFIVGAGMSGFETVSNVIIVRVFEAESKVLMQICHFCYNLGGIVTPFLVEPFLNEAPNGRNISSNRTFNDSFFPQIKLIENTSIPLVAIPYFIIASMALLIIFFLILTVPSSFLNIKVSEETSLLQNEDKQFRWMLIALIFFMIFFYVGCELVIVNFLYTFAVIDYPGLNLSKLSGTHLYSVYSFGFFIGQFFVVIGSFKISSTKILAIDNFGMTLGGVTLAFLPLYRHEAPVLLWVGVGIIGMFGASIYGTTFVWAETYITINATAAAMITAGASLGEMLLTIPVGLMIEKNPLSFNYISASYILATALTFIIMWRFALSKGERNSIR